MSKEKHLRNILRKISCKNTQKDCTKNKGQFGYSESSVTRLGEILLSGYFLLDHLLHFELNKQLSVDVLDFQFEL